LVSNGITVLRVQNTSVTHASTTPPGTVTFQRGDAPKIAAARRGGVDRVIVWVPSTQDGNQVYIFDESGALKSSCAFTGEIKTVLDGPKLVRIPEGSRFELELVDLDRVEGGAACTDQSLVTPYLVPPMDEGASGSLATGDSAYFAGKNQLAYWYASSAATSYAGVLDLASGLSQAINLGIAIENGALFGDVGETEVFGVFGEPAAQQFKSFRIPALAR
jgi:hypothetical protein